MDNYDDGYTCEDKDTFKDSHRPRIGKYVKKVLKFIAILLIILVYIMIHVDRRDARGIFDKRRAYRDETGVGEPDRQEWALSDQ